MDHHRIDQEQLVVKAVRIDIREVPQQMISAALLWREGKDHLLMIMEDLPSTIKEKCLLAIIPHKARHSKDFKNHGVVLLDQMVMDHLLGKTLMQNLDTMIGEAMGKAQYRPCEKTLAHHQEV
jgi:hypothetical protein